MDRVAFIEETLRSAFAPVHLEVEDESHLHAGHAGARSGGGHFKALVVSSAFAGLSQVARQRAVYAAMGDAMRTEIHALSLRTLTPEEYGGRG